MPSPPKLTINRFGSQRLPQSGNCLGTVVNSSATKALLRRKVCFPMKKCF